MINIVRMQFPTSGPDISANLISAQAEGRPCSFVARGVRVQRHLVSRSTLPIFRAEAADQWKNADAAA